MFVRNERKNIGGLIIMRILELRNYIIFLGEFLLILIVNIYTKNKKKICMYVMAVLFKIVKLDSKFKNT